MLRFPIAGCGPFIPYHVDAALHVEILLGDIVVFAIEDFFEAADRLGNRNILACSPGENFGDVERLAQETLDFARAENVNLSSGLSSSMPRIAMMSCKSL